MLCLCSSLTALCFFWRGWVVVVGGGGRGNGVHPLNRYQCKVYVDIMLLFTVKVSSQFGLITPGAILNLTLRNSKT